MITKEKIYEIMGIISKYLNLLIWAIRGQKYLTVEEFKENGADDITKLIEGKSIINCAISLGKFEAISKDDEYKKLTLSALEDDSKAVQGENHELQIEKAELRTSWSIRYFIDSIHQEILELLLNNLGTDNDEKWDEIIKKIEEIFNNKKNEWFGLALHEMNISKQNGKIAAIVDKIDIYKGGNGKDSLVTIVLDINACSDCKKLYLDSETGNPKIFKLRELINNTGTNWGSKWRDKVKPVIPPLHPNCMCSIKYVPHGFGWNEKGEFVLLNTDSKNIKKSLDILDGDEALKSLSKLESMTKPNSNNCEKYNFLKQMSMAAMFQEFFIKNDGLSKKE